MSSRFQFQEHWSFMFFLQEQPVWKKWQDQLQVSFTWAPFLIFHLIRFVGPARFYRIDQTTCEFFGFVKIWRGSTGLTRATRKLTGLLLYLSCLVNPLLYTCFGSSMRKKLGQIMRHSFSQESLENTFLSGHIFKFVPRSLTQHLRILAPRGQLPPWILNRSGFLRGRRRRNAKQRILVGDDWDEAPGTTKQSLSPNLSSSLVRSFSAFQKA